MSKLKKIYEFAPVWAQNTMVTGFGLYWHWLRFSGSYKAHLAGYKEREWFSVNDWSSYQRDQLIDLLSTCLEHVPYYRETWNEHNKKAALSGELDVLPFVEKDAVRKTPERFCREDINPFPQLTHHTSGTTSLNC